MGAHGYGAIKMIHDSTTLRSLIGKDAKLIHGEKRFQLAIESRPPCTQNCPAGINVKGYVSLVANKRYEDALELIRENNPFPGICGRVCTHPCEANCQRSEVDAPLSIKALKRFVADYEVSRKKAGSQRYPVRYDEKIAVIGSGPAGLTTAVDLVKLGYTVTVFEAMEKAGGMLAWGIPEFRLPRKVLQRELGIITSWGVEIRTRVKVEDPGQLLTEGFHAVVVAAGSWKGLPLKIEGEELGGVVDCLEFLRSVYRRELKEIGGTVVVLGGGDSAFDAARTALRLGAGKVIIAYRRTENEMPATSSEVREAKEEGIEVVTLCIPKRIVGEGRVTGIELLRAELGELDESGRRRPVALEGSEFVLDCDIVIPAIGARPEFPDIERKGITLSKRGLVQVDEHFRSSRDRIYAVGDVVRGPSTIVDVIGDAHHCAATIHSELRGVVGEEFIRAYTERKGEKPGVVVLGNVIEPKPRQEIPVLPAEERRQCFEEMKCGYSELVALRESSRCQRCGSCGECHVCLPTCDSKQVVASLDGRDFLLKLPCELSRELYEGNGEEWSLVASGKRKEFLLRPLTPVVDPKLCIACGRCEEACSYRAVRVGLKAGGVAYAYIDHDVCRSCGRCVLSCPTGAISLDLYSDTNIQEQIKSSIRKNNGIAVFASYWDLLGTDEPSNAVELMCSMGVTPWLIIQALAFGAKGVLVLHSDTGDEHYLPVEYDVEEQVKSTKEILELAGVEPERVMCSVFSPGFYRLIIKDFGARLNSKGLEPYAPLTKDEENRLPPGRVGRELFLVELLAAREGNVVSPLNLLSKVLEGARLPELREMLESVARLVAVFGIEYGNCTRKAEQHEEVVVASIEGYRDIKGYLKNLKNGDRKLDVVVLPSLVVRTFPSRRFRAARGLRVGFLGGSSGDWKPFYDAMTIIVFAIPGCEFVLLGDMDCGATDWKWPDAEARRKAMDVFKAAGDRNIDIIITPSVGCLTHMRACNRPGAWRHSPVEVIDPYSFIVSFLEGGAGDE